MSNVGTTQRRPSWHVELSRRIVWKICRLVSRKRVLIEIKSVIHSSTYPYSLDSFMYFCAFCIRIGTTQRRPSWHVEVFFDFAKIIFEKLRGSEEGDCQTACAPSLVEMFNCIIDTVEDSSSVRSYRNFLIANFCYKYIHKTIKLTEHYNTLKMPPVAATIRK